MTEMTEGSGASTVYDQWPKTGIKEPAAGLYDIPKQIAEKEKEHQEAMNRAKEMVARNLCGPQTKPDNWQHRATGMRCETCMWFVRKITDCHQAKSHFIGRCRKHAPTLNGWPVVYSADFCGDHKIDEAKLWSPQVFTQNRGLCLKSWGVYDSSPLHQMRETALEFSSVRGAVGGG